MTRSPRPSRSAVQRWPPASIQINLTNDGPAITSWTLAYSYTGNQQIAGGWAGNWSQSGENITVTNASYNGSMSTGTTINIGSNFSYSGTNVAPTVFTLNGTQCNGGGGGGGGGGGNTVTVNSPGNQSGTVGTAASLQMSASDSASEQTLTWSASGLPGGLSINTSSGLISGTPTTAATSTVTVTVREGTGATGSATFYLDHLDIRHWQRQHPGRPVVVLRLAGR